MKIVSELLDSVKAFDTPVRNVHILYRCAFVESRDTGVASILRVDDCMHMPIPDAGSLHEKNAVSLGEYALSENLIAASLGIAAINSLTPIDESRCIELNAHEYISEKGKDKKVAVIGHFPFVDGMRNEVNKLWVFEKNPQEGDNTELEMPEILPQCDIIGITGTTIINKTLEKVLSYCKSDSKKILLGPSTPMNPLLFDWGIDVISGVLFTDPYKAFRHLSQGGTFQKIVGTKRLSMEKNTI